MCITALAHYKKITLIVLIMLTGCASGGGKRNEIGLFDTTVKGDDIRLFRYTLPLFREKPKPITQRSDGQRSRNAEQRESEETQLKRAEYYLEQDPRVKKYCPKGYTMTDKYAVLNEIIIRGECRYTD